MPSPSIPTQKPVNERRFRDNIERYGKLFEDEATKKEVSQLKAERAEKNINAIRAMGIEV